MFCIKDAHLCLPHCTTASLLCFFSNVVKNAIFIATHSVGTRWRSAEEQQRKEGVKTVCVCKKVKIGKAAVVATAKPLGLLLCSSTPSFSTPYFFEWSRNGWDKEASSEKNTKIFLNLFRLSKIFLKLLNCYHIVNCLIKHNSWQRFEKIFKKQKRFYKPYFFFQKNSFTRISKMFL